MRSRNVWRILLMVGALALLAATVPIAGAGANGAVNGTYPLYAGQDIPVGDVTVTNDTENLYVTFTMDADYCMMGTHLQVGDLDDVQTKKGNPIPGKFAYSMEHDCAYSYMYTVPLDGLAAEDIVEIAAHADVKAPIDGETCDVWMIGDEEAPYLDTGLLSNYADEFNWASPAGPATRGPSLVVDTPLFTDPFIVGSTPTSEFPYNSNKARGYATDFDVEWEGHLHFGGTLTVSWSPGQSAFEEKEVTFGTSTATFTQDGEPKPGAGWFWDVYPLYEDSMSVDPLGFATHTINFLHTTGDGTFWDWVLLERPCETYESAWGATAVGEIPFTGKNWATYFTYTVEKVYLETVQVPSRHPTLDENQVVESATTLLAGVDYELAASGTYVFANWADGGIADAQWNQRQDGTWRNGDLNSHENFLEVWVNGGAFDWMPESFQASHEYSGVVGGADAKATFTIMDACKPPPAEDGCYTDNVGSIPVEIWWLG